jgi:hypothetical protein
MATTTFDPTDCGKSESEVLALPLKSGGHSGGGEFRGECCLVEKSNRLAFCIPAFREEFGAPERFTDDHPSIRRTVRAMAIGLNDMTWESDDARTASLDRFSVAILGTATTPEDEETCAWMATDWLIRVYTPAWLRLAGLTTEAQALEGLARVVDSVTARNAQPTINRASAKAPAAWDAAWDAAWVAARDAARAAAWAAAWDAAGAAARDAAWAAARDAARAAAWAAAGAAAGAAARAAAWDAAGDAARAAARAAAGDAAGAAAGDAAGDAAWDAAWDAARAAAWDAARDAARAAAGDAAGDAARAALAPTALALRTSAIELLDAMIAVGKEPS